jgi:hypothetical protein
MVCTLMMYRKCQEMIAVGITPSFRSNHHHIRQQQSPSQSGHPPKNDETEMSPRHQQTSSSGLPAFRQKHGTVTIWALERLLTTSLLPCYPACFSDFPDFTHLI